MLIDEIVSERDDKALSVNLVINMADYCTACVQLYKNEKSLQQQFEAANPKIARSDDEPNDGYLREQREYVELNLDPKIQRQFNEERAQVATKVAEHSFDGYDIQIKETLASLCSPTARHENFLADQLRSPLNEVPIIHLFNNHFKELLKNSMDSMILRYMKGSSADTTLKLRVSIPTPILEGNVSLEITDNAGGFPPSYITSFTTTIHNEKNVTIDDIPPSRHRSEKAHGNPYRTYCFGGEGAGMLGCAREAVAISALSSMAIGNVINPDNSTGAKITVNAPLNRPETPYIQRKYSSSSSNGGSAVATSGPPSAMLLKTPPPPKTPSPLVATSMFKASTATATEAATGAHAAQVTQTEIKKKLKPAPLLIIKPSEGPQ